MRRRTFLGLIPALACLKRAVGAEVVAFARQPYLQRVLADRATILWTTLSSASGTVSVIGSNGESATFTATAQVFDPSVTGMSLPYYQYQADITGLDAGSYYTYSVLMNGQYLSLGSPEFSFTTPSPGVFSFLSFGDSGADSPQQLALIQQMMNEPGIAKVIHVGDLAYMSGTFAEFEANYFSLNAGLMSRLPFFATPGNHEYDTPNAVPYLAGHVAPLSNVPAPDVGRYYSFDWGDAHFASVDSNLLSSPSEPQMLAWLDKDLGASTKFWKIVFLHHPAYPTGTHVGDPLCVLSLQNVNPIVEKHGVQLVLSGHEHGYERTWPLAGGQPVTSGPSTTYVITGGGGQFMEQVGSLPQCALSVQAFHYLRVDVTNTQLRVTATGLGGTVVDQFTIAPPPAIAANGVLSTGDYTPSIASGSLASIFGQNFAIRAASSGSMPLPDKLGGVTVTANGRSVPLLYASPGQLNVQIPYEVSGQVTLEVTTPNGTASITIPVAPVAPSILAIAVQNALNSASNPASQSGYVTVYATGLGPAATAVPTGQPAPGVPNPMMAQVRVQLGDTPVQPMYAGMAPGFAGLSQINFAVPAGLANGVYPLTVSAAGASSQPQSVVVGSAMQTLAVAAGAHRGSGAAANPLAILTATRR